MNGWRIPAADTSCLLELACRIGIKDPTAFRPRSPIEGFEFRVKADSQSTAMTIPGFCVSRNLPNPL